MDSISLYDVRTIIVSQIPRSKLQSQNRAVMRRTELRRDVRISLEMT